MSSDGSGAVLSERTSCHAVTTLLKRQGEEQDSEQQLHCNKGGVAYRLFHCELFPFQTVSELRFKLTVLAAT
jgi:hypothetical protein